MTRAANYMPQAWAMIAGVKVQVVGFECTYALNSLPTAVVHLPIGRSSVDGKPAAVHELAGALADEQPVQVWLSFEKAARLDAGLSDFGMPKGSFKVFEGFTAGPSWPFRGCYSVACNHWLARLAQGSVFSATSHPGNPARFSYGATQAGGSGAALNWTVLSQAAKFVTRDNLAADVWGKALRPWLESLAASDGFWAAEKSLKAGPANSKKVAEALSRFASSGDYKALALRSVLSVDADLADAVAKDVARTTFSPAAAAQAAHQTLWDLLVGKLAADYMFAVVPRVEDALIVPYAPGYRGAGAAGAAAAAGAVVGGIGAIGAAVAATLSPNGAYAYIRSGEVVGGRASMRTQRPLRAYGVLGFSTTPTGAVRPGAEVDFESMGLGGWYEAADKPDGAVVVGSCPAWMASAGAASFWAGRSTGADGGVVRTADSPAAGDATGADAAARARAAGRSKKLLDAYAKMRYAQTALANRSMVIQGPLRFDVAPGSVVEVEGPSESVRAADGGSSPAVSYFGDVLLTTFCVDAESRAVGTTFHIENVRTRDANESSDYAVDAHPVYEETFLGCRLVTS